MGASPVSLNLGGVLAVQAASSSPTTWGMSDAFALEFQATYAQAKGSAPFIQSTDVAPFVVPFEGISRAHAYLILVNGPSMVVKITTAEGADQEIPVSGMFLWHSPNNSDAITAIKIVGTGSVQYFLAGDQS